MAHLTLLVHPGSLVMAVYWLQTASFAVRICHPRLLPTVRSYDQLEPSRKCQASFAVPCTPQTSWQGRAFSFKRGIFKPTFNLSLHLPLVVNSHPQFSLRSTSACRCKAKFQFAPNASRATSCLEIHEALSYPTSRTHISLTPLEEMELRPAHPLRASRSCS